MVKDKSDETYRIVFTLRQVDVLSNDKRVVTLDCFSLIPWSKTWEGLTMDEIRAANILSNEQFVPKEPLAFAGNMLGGMRMRARYTNDVLGPYVVSSDTPLTRYEFESLISSWDKTRIRKLEKGSKL